MNELLRMRLKTVIKTGERKMALLSGKHLDFVSLAVCSCVLTLLCHSIADLPQTSSSTANRPSAQSASPSSQGGTATVAFKPYTLPSSRPEVESEEEFQG